MEGNAGTLFSLEDKIDEKLLQARRIFLSEAVCEKTAREIIRQLWYLDLQNPGEPIYFFINSPGGAINSGFAIWDQGKMISSPIVTIVTGLAASFGTILMLMAAPGKRFSTPNARVMIHQPLIHGVIEGQATDLEIQAREIVKNRSKTVELYAEATGKDFQTIEKMIDRDSWMSAEETKEFGLIDRIVTRFDEVEAAMQ